MPELSAQDAENRFLSVFRAFLVYLRARNIRLRSFSTTCNGWMQPRSN